jgi:4-amino-4-deoxy-L-arabinose transferase-like glycosyltransferase
MTREENNLELNNFLIFKKIRPFWFLFLVGFILYFSALFFGFTYLDDNNLILDNQYFLSNFSNIIESFKIDVFHLFNHSAFYYRPILTISFLFDYQIGGINPFIYHFTNILLHIISSFLVFLFLFKLKYKKESSFLFALIFLVHPVLTQAVSWVPGRNDSLLMVFVLFSFVFFIDYLNKDRIKYLILSLLFVFLSFFTKESGIFIIPLLLFFSFFIYKKEENKKDLFKKVFIYTIGSFLIFLIWLFLRNNALSGSSGLSLVEIFRSLFSNSPAIVQFIGKIFLPFNLSVIPIMENTTFIYGIISVFILFYLIFKTENKRWIYIIFGFIWFLAFLMPSFIRPNSKLVADFIEHRVYIPIVGIFIILLETKIFKNINLENKKIKNIFIIIILLFSLITFFHNFTFRNRTSFWENAVLNSPDYPLAHRNLGAMKFLDGDYNTAEREFLKSIELNPNEEMAHNNLGLIYARRGDYEKAEMFYKKELEINPYYDNAHFNLGLLYFNLNRKEEAVLFWKKTLEINPNFIDAIKSLASYYYEEKDYKEMTPYLIILKNMGFKIPEEMLKFININSIIK